MNEQKKKWPYVVLIVTIIITVFNIIGTIVSVIVVSNIHFEPYDITESAKNMPFNSSTPYEIYRKPADPNADFSFSK